MAIAPVLKTGVRKDLGVRIPRPPLVPRTSIRRLTVTAEAQRSRRAACSVQAPNDSPYASTAFPVRIPSVPQTPSKRATGATSGRQGVIG